MLLTFHTDSTLRCVLHNIASTVAVLRRCDGVSIAMTFWHEGSGGTYCYPEVRWKNDAQLLFINLADTFGMIPSYTVESGSVPGTTVFIAGQNKMYDHLSNLLTDFMLMELQAGTYCADRQCRRVRIEATGAAAYEQVAVDGAVSTLWGCTPEGEVL